MRLLFSVEGKMSTFGGPKDTGMLPDEGLALFDSQQDMVNHGIGDFLLPETKFKGLGRRLDPSKPYIACRWWETSIPRAVLKTSWVMVENRKTGQRAKARPVDAGPAAWTNRVADLSPGLAQQLKLKTDDICAVTLTDGGTEFKTSYDHDLGALALPPIFTAPPIYTTEEWGAVPAKVSYFPQKHAVGIVIHNTEGANRRPYDSASDEVAAAFRNARSIQNSHMGERGWQDTGQHFTISQGGVITEGRHGTLAAARAGNVVRGAHAPGANDEWWGIEIAGDNRADYVVTDQQFTALIALGKWLQLMAGQRLRIQPHNRFRNTSCPGKILEHIAEIRTAIGGTE